jgi:uncharacterized protein YraI
MLYCLKIVIYLFLLKILLILQVTYLSLQAGVSRVQTISRFAINARASPVTQVPAVAGHPHVVSSAIASVIVF